MNKAKHAANIARFRNKLYDNGFVGVTFYIERDVKEQLAKMYPGSHGHGVNWTQVTRVALSEGNDGARDATQDAA